MYVLPLMVNSSPNQLNVLIGFSRSSESNPITFLNNITKLVVVSEVQFASVEVFTEAQLISDILDVTPRCFFLRIRQVSKEHVAFALKGQVDRVLRNVGTEFALLFRWVSGFIGPQAVTRLSRISSHPKK